jgi:prevent-host-death family protein
MATINLEQDIRPLSEFRADAAGFLERIRRTKRALVLTQRGHTSAVVLDVAEYQRILDELDLLRDVHTALRQIEQGEGVPQQEAKRRALSRLRD